MKYNPQGNVIWARRYGGDHDDHADGIVVDAIGNLYLTGGFTSSTISFGSTTLTNADPGTFDFYLTKFDSSCNSVWAKRAGGNETDYSNSMDMDVNQDLYITGNFFSSTITFGSTTLHNGSGLACDFFVTKFDTSGNILWATSAGGDNYDVGGNIKVDANSNAYIIGEFSSSSISFGNTTLINSGQYDFYLSKLDFNTGLSDEINQDGNNVVIHNPGNGQIRIYSLEKIQKIIITNLQGQIIYHSQPDENNYTYFFDSDGIYFVTIRTNGHAVTKKILIQH